MITIVRLVNTSITSHSYVVCMMKTFKLYSLSNSQVHKTVLLTIATMLYVRSPERIYLIIKYVAF